MIVLTNFSKAPTTMWALDLEDLSGRIKQAHISNPTTCAPDGNCHVKIWLAQHLSTLKDMNEVKLEVHHWDDDKHGYTSATHLRVG